MTLQHTVARAAIPAMPDTLIRIDRSRPPEYPTWVKNPVEGRELQLTGPAVYDITHLERWFHEGQSWGDGIEGGAIFERLQCTGLWATCLDLRDGVEIMNKGTAFFMQHFADAYIPLWRSLAVGRNGQRMIPYCFCFLGRVAQSWRYLDAKLDTGFVTYLRP